MQKNIVLVAGVALAVGLIGGYVLHGCCGKGMASKDDAQRPAAGMHMMADGSMMHDSTSMDHGEPMSMEQMMHDMNAALRGKSGDELDKAFLREMIVHHQGAVDMAELVRRDAKHKEIRDLAEAIIVAQEKEIADMKSWQQQWYGVAP